MFLRTLTSVVMVALVAALLFIGEAAIGSVVALFAFIGTNELYKAEEKGGSNPVKWVSVLFAVPILLYMMNLGYNYFSVCIYAIGSIVFFVCIIRNNKYTVEDAVLTIISGLAVSNMFYCILAVYKTGGNKSESALVLGLILIGACITDIFAYLVGSAVGKHKLCPSISPKKSVEGSIGGMLCVTIAMVLYGYFVLSKNIDAFSQVSIYEYAVLGLVCGIVSQIGDLSASMVKRHYGIKDFGKIFPGHGGILDRFDSFIFVAPVIFFFVREWIKIQ